MPIVLLSIFAGLCYIVWLFWDYHQFVKALEVFDEHQAIKNRLFELRDDAFMSDIKFRSWVPLCQLADERFAQLCLPKFPSLANQRTSLLVLKQILNS